MQKAFHFIVELFYWLAIFISPFLIGIIAGALIYIANQNLLWLSIAVISIAAVIGVLFAERARKKYGCSRYMAGIMTTQDPLPNEEKEAKNPK